MTDDIPKEFWKKYIAAEYTVRNDLLAKTLLPSLLDVMKMEGPDEVKRTIIVTTVKSYFDDLIEYFESDERLPKGMNARGDPSEVGNRG